jgi:hypothetical protein
VNAVAFVKSADARCNLRRTTRVEVANVRGAEAVSTPQAAAEWLERYLLDHPSEMTLGLLRNLLGVS